MANATRAVAYYRTSTLQQTQSIPQQRDWACEVCANESIDLVTEFQDEAISGNKRKPTPTGAVRRVSLSWCWKPTLTRDTSRRSGRGRNETRPRRTP
jgi:hypothetical protein